MTRSLTVIGCSLLFAVTACSAASEPSHSSPPTSRDGEEEAASNEVRAEDSDETEAGSKTERESETPPVRPEPRETVRDCGRALTRPTALSTYTQWVGFKAVKLGARVVRQGDAHVATDEIWATGTAKRLSTAPNGDYVVGKDVSVEPVRDALGLKDPDEVTSDALLNGPAGANGEQARRFYTPPSSTTLTFVEAWNQTEIGWLIPDPKRTATTGSDGAELFVRSLIPGRFFGYELVLSLPDDCAVGALGDVLGERASLLGVTTGEGIFDPAKMAAVQKVLVENGARMEVRVTANKRNAEVESLLSSTSCSPGDLAACKRLIEELQRLSNELRTVAPSIVTKLQKDEDPNWSTLELGVSPVAILP